MAVPTETRIPLPVRGRGTTHAVASRFERLERVPDDPPEDEPAPRQVATQIIHEHARSIVSTNDSPDVPFNRSINPYAGCEHGCIYCFARPTHGYRGLNPGLDFETKIIAKDNAVDLLRRELEKPSYRPETIVLGANTDPYQPIEREMRLTRRILELLTECRHPTGIVTKSGLVVRDIDLLAELARFQAIHVCVSITTLDTKLSRIMEPRASAPQRRLDAVRALAAAQVPVAVLVSPLIPAINDHEIEAILEAAAEAGASAANSILVRLPWEVKELFEGWLQTHFAERKERVLQLIRQSRGGKLYEATWGNRMRGDGPYAQILFQRFEVAKRRLGLDRRSWEASAAHFRQPSGGQLALALG